MKTIKRNNDYKRLSDSNSKDLNIIDSFLKAGWNFCPKSEYKNINNTPKTKDVVSEQIEDVPVKDKKRGKNKK